MSNQRPPQPPQPSSSSSSFLENDDDDIDDDPMQNVLNEAQELMETLGMSDEQQPSQAQDRTMEEGMDAASLVIDGFAIDSDDEQEEFPSSSAVPSSETKSLLDAKLNPPAKKNIGIQQPMTAADDDAPHPLHPLVQDVQVSSPAASTSNPTSTTTPAASSTMATKAGAAATTTTTTSATTIPPAATTSSSFDFKAKTSLFASNLATFAQKAASQVADQISTTTTSTAHAVTDHIPHHHHGVVVPSLSSSTTTTTPIIESPLDKDQKAQLIHDHVGPLLPGERVIMFLQNLLHVSDSSSLPYNTYGGSGSGSGSGKCCWYACMTYYRMILFSVDMDDTKDDDEYDISNHKESSASSPTRPPVEWNPHVWSLPPMPPRLLQIPLASIDKLEKTVYTTTTKTTNTTTNGSTTTTATGLPSSSSSTSSLSNGGVVGGATTSTTLMGLVIYGKDNGRYLRFTAPSFADTQRAYEALNTYAFPGRRNLGYLFAFESRRNDVMQSIVEDASKGTKQVTLPPTRKRFDALLEFPRQFRQLQVWTCWTQLNQQYQLCMSYPSVLAGPASLQEASPESVRILRASAAFRSEQRLPVLTWSCGIDGASLWRASQPKVGLQGNRSSADEVYLKHIAESAMTTNALREGPRPTLPSHAALQHLTGSLDLKEWTLDSNCQLKILDLRPKSSAMANRTGGYGYENTSYYTGCTIQFCNIANIHAVRDSYQKMSALCLSPSTSDVQWSQLVEDTKWLSHIRLILAASWETAYWIHVHRLPVLLHCSHGWDRTGQVAVLAQLLLDPHYRTREGFSCLVEKDFMSFGHPFHTRCAHGEGRGERDTPSGNSGDEGQISQIFIQFLDCVYQIVNQYPECFEFNTKYLLVLSEHVYSSRFGTMLCDTERERELIAGIRQRTHSLWDYLDERDDLKNPSFRNDGGVLLMPLPTLLRNVSLWVDRHCMFGPKPTMRSLPTFLERPPPTLPRDQQSPLHMKDDYFKLSLRQAEQQE